MAKHFFRLLAVFFLMIILGLIGVFIVNSFSQQIGQAAAAQAVK